MIADISKIVDEVWQRALGHEPNIHCSNIVFDSVELSEIEATHGVQLLAGMGSIDSNWFLDETAFPGETARIAASRVYDRVSFNIFTREALFGYSLAVVSVNGTWAGSELVHHIRLDPTCAQGSTYMHQELP